MNTIRARLVDALCLCIAFGCFALFVAIITAAR